MAQARAPQPGERCASPAAREEAEEQDEAPPSPRRAPSPAVVSAALRWTSFAKLPGPYAAQMCDLIEPQPAEKIGKMKKLRRTLSESFSRIGECSPLSLVS